ncbi:N-acetyltransferase family protein [Rubrivirga sp. IMCC43871]|uniref:GNAT family N-acetyltransferase n=1 Tax=Rubrivirga sp. IMCC43871 TaxID=3391575 RepID=UPI00398FEB3B
MTLRPATPADAALVCTLVHELADYEKAPASEVPATPDAFAVALAPSAEPRLGCLLAFAADGDPAGVAIFFPAFSTWRAGWGLYLEDLFVRPEHRGQGVGLALFRAVAAEAVARGAERLEWIVLDWNALALDFYRRLGAESLDEWTKMRLSGDALAALADGQDPDERDRA